MKKRVFLAKCESYDSEKIKELLSRGLDALSIGNDYFLDKNLLLKPNLLSDKSPDHAVTTHPEFVRAVGELFKERGQKFDIGDSPGATLVTIGKLWDITGMQEVADSLGKEMVNFTSFNVKNIEAKRSPFISEVPVSNVLEKYDGIVNLPKMKTHSLMGFTGAVKNLYGLVPGFYKVNCHKLANKAVHFADILVYIYQNFKPMLNIIDGILGMEGNGPAAGEPRELKTILMGTDAIAVDVVMASLMGINLKNDPLFKAFKRFGIEVPELSEIEILGDSFESLTPENFKLSKASKMNYLPAWAMNIIGKLLWVYPEMVEDKCTVCKLCAKGCPVDAITFTDKVAVVDRKKCISCFCCTEICPSNAVKFDYSYLASKFIRFDE